MNAMKEALVQDFVREASGLSVLDADANETVIARAATETLFVALASDPKFRDAWADPEFQSVCGTALSAEIAKRSAGLEVGRKVVRFYEQLQERLGDGRLDGRRD